jgi:hypothetical protein
VYSMRKGGNIKQRHRTNVEKFFFCLARTVWFEASRENIVSRGASNRCIWEPRCLIDCLRLVEMYESEPNKPSAFAASRMFFI